MLCRPANSGHYLRLLSSPTPRLHDPRTGEMWLLPLGGSFKAYNERRCPLCDFELLLFTVSGRGRGSSTRAYPLCPYCYNHPPIGEKSPAAAVDEAPGTRCSRCPHPEEHPIVSELSVCTCPRRRYRVGGSSSIQPGRSGGSSRREEWIPSELPPFVYLVSISGVWLQRLQLVQEAED